LKLTQYITEPEFAFPINWWDFKYVFQDINYIPPSRGWDKGTYVNDIISTNNEGNKYMKPNNNIFLITIHNGWIRNQGLNKNAQYPNNSLFERLNKFING
jgi:hypothetical protein